MLERFSYDHAAFVIVTHLALGWKSVLAELLQRHTVLEVEKVTEETPMFANHAYVLGEGIEITCARDRIRCHERLEGRVSRPIDRFFTSLAHSWRRRALGVILSGAGTDGTLGLHVMQTEGARTFVQEPTSALFSSMPRKAQPFADVCMDPRALGDEITRLLREFRAEEQHQRSQSSRPAQSSRLAPK
jgi:chemotaxis response regulator CheB